MLHTIVALIIFLFPLAYSPGPGNMFFAANGARFGFWPTMPANIGYHVATWVITLVIGFGFSMTMADYPYTFQVLKIGGAFYVLWIAWKLLKPGTLAGSETAKSISFLDGVLLLVLNPKAYIIILLMFTQFLPKIDSEPVFAVLLITSIFTINNFLAFLIWTAVGDKIASRFRTKKGAQRLNLLFAAVLAAVAVWMLFI